MKRFTGLAVAAACAALVLAACGGGGDAPKVASANTTASINASTGAQLVEGLSNVPMAFNSGVDQFGTTGTATTVQLNGGSSPTFAVSAGGNTASGDLGFGSCIFKITTSTFPASHPLAAGKTIEVTPCDISVATANQTASGTPVNTSVNLVLGSSKSDAKTFPITITTGGSVVITNPVTNKTVTLGTVSVTAVTGAS